MNTHKLSITGFSLLLSAAFVLSAPQLANAQKAAKKKATTPTTVEPKGEAVSSDGPALKFSTGDEAAPNTDYRDSIKFTDKASGATGDSTPTQPKNDFSAPEEGFRTYLGYPKHQVGLLAGFNSLKSVWGYNGQDFTFTSSPIEYGLGYQFLGTPQWKLGAYYTRSTVKLPAGTASGYTFRASEEDLDRYGLNTEYCMISSANFYRQYCFGGTLANDSYPVLKFVSGTALEMSSVSDIVVGIHGAVQIPITEKVLFKPMVGYNYGTGAGSSGTLTSKGNSMIWARGEVPFNLSPKWLIKLHGDYQSRQATIEGKIGANTDKWETDSVMLGGGADVFYNF